MWHNRADAAMPPVSMPMSSPAMEKIWRAYSGLALLVFNTFLFLFLFNGALFCVFYVYDHARAAKARQHRVEQYGATLQAVYPGLGDEEIETLRRESLGIFRFEPFTMYRDRPRRGKFINVDENGFRLSSNQGPWPPARENFNIFLFGGSTTFGWAVRDQDTVASHLQEQLLRLSGRRVCDG